jgi:hypothetical protein
MPATSIWESRRARAHTLMIFKFFYNYEMSKVWKFGGGAAGGSGASYGFSGRQSGGWCKEQGIK